jgi:hypothetical protein
VWMRAGNFPVTSLTLSTMPPAKGVHALRTAPRPGKRMLSVARASRWGVATHPTAHRCPMPCVDSGWGRGVVSWPERSGRVKRAGVVSRGRREATDVAPTLRVAVVFRTARAWTRKGAEMMSRAREVDQKWIIEEI